MADVVLRSDPLGQPWAGTDPFLFCVYHQDDFPAADGAQGVDPSHLTGRAMGQDFSGRDGFSMYHGTRVPGFPAHPHRGFETVTIVNEGVVDHADSLGAAARYGDGDVQWLTAGHGVMHSEMFPLRSRQGPNPLDLYQIWLNLPPQDKMADPAFVVQWADDVPVYRVTSAAGAVAAVRIVAGDYRPQEGADRAPLEALPATPKSWSGRAEGDVAIWQISLEPGAAITLPPAMRADARRNLYFHQGDRLDIAGVSQAGGRLIAVVADAAMPIVNSGQESARILLLQGVPIGAPVVAHGPFVMNTAQEIEQAIRDFHQTQFGGWPWGAAGPVHPDGQPRFALPPGAAEPELPPA
ncbi:pirin family protein [Altererythrobacter xixiisoli]|uniref:Pirin family protein n=1 Tax=Croceibacterium xixiisoli TaxID=1476466 RepID=A0A6I4TR36_9SPHN|nr:pirin family protein [Croceibacterium xixiisoli]MXO98344.1 pirin family protein [Croceibacterium xixiisoli]